MSETVAERRWRERIEYLSKARNIAKILAQLKKKPLVN